MSECNSLESLYKEQCQKEGIFKEKSQELTPTTIIIGHGEELAKARALLLICLKICL